MQEKIDLMDWIEIYAEHGATNAILRVWQSQMPKLIREGFSIKKIAQTSVEHKFYCRISWSHPTNANGLASKMLEVSQSA